MHVLYLFIKLSRVVLFTIPQVVRLWDPRTRNHFGTLQGHLDVVKALAVNADGTR